MAYINQETKKMIADLVKPVLKKYGISATFAVRHHMSLVLNIKSGKIDFIGNSKKVCAKKYPAECAINNREVTHIDVNTYWYQDHFDGVAKEFFDEVLPLLNTGNYNNSDVQTDYFDVGFYLDVNVGKWNKPYILEK